MSCRSGAHVEHRLLLRDYEPSLTIELRFCYLFTFFKIEFNTQSLWGILHQVLYTASYVAATQQVNTIAQWNNNKKDIPAKSSSFSLPNNLVNMVTSPDPFIPSFPFRKTKARSVEGFVPPCLRRRVGPSCQTSLGPVGTMAEDWALRGAIKEGAMRYYADNVIEFRVLESSKCVLSSLWQGHSVRHHRALSFFWNNFLIGQRLILQGVLNQPVTDNWYFLSRRTSPCQLSFERGQTGKNSPGGVVTWLHSVQQMQSQVSLTS